VVSGCRGMRIRSFASPEAAARALAAAVARAIRANPRLVLGLPTGRTPVRFYRELAACGRARRVDFAQVSTFNLDEFVGLDAADPRSYRTFMQRNLFDAVNISPHRIHFLNGRARDTAAECARYERAIARAGGIDLLVLGLGANGHIGFNEPARKLTAATHRTRLTLATRRANAALFGGRVSAVPREALSMGMATILGARRIVLLATGAGKARTVARMIDGPVTTRLPASFLQLHARAEVWLDKAAASKI
jgi:glucosamine-6-phosphate deaminase